MGMTVLWNDAILTVQEDSSSGAGFGDGLGNILDPRATKYWTYDGMSSPGDYVKLAFQLRAVAPWAGGILIALPRGQTLEGYDIQVELFLNDPPFPGDLVYDSGVVPLDIAGYTDDAQPFTAHAFRQTTGGPIQNYECRSAYVTFFWNGGPGQFQISRIALMKALDIVNAGIGVQAAAVYSKAPQIGQQGHIFHDPRANSRKLTYGFLPTGAEMFGEGVTSAGVDFQSFLLESGKSKEVVMYTSRAPGMDELDDDTDVDTEVPLNAYGLITNDASLTVADNSDGDLVGTAQVEVMEIV